MPKLKGTVSRYKNGKNNLKFKKWLYFKYFFLEFSLVYPYICIGLYLNVSISFIQAYGRQDEAGRFSPHVDQLHGPQEPVRLVAWWPDWKLGELQPKERTPTYGAIFEESKKWGGERGIQNQRKMRLMPTTVGAQTCSNGWEFCARQIYSGIATLEARRFWFYIKLKHWWMAVQELWFGLTKSKFTLMHLIC